MMLFVNLVVEIREHVQYSVRPIEESVFQYQAEEKVSNVLPASLRLNYNGGKVKSNFILTSPITIPKGK